MKYCLYKTEQKVPVFDEVDVLVVGGGCAGISAAVSAAAHGVRVLLAERSYCLGGTATGGLVGPFMTCSDPDGKKQLIKGFFQKFVDRMISKGGALDPMSIKNCEGYSSWHMYGHQNVTPFNQNVYMFTAEEFCAENNVRLLYGVTAFDVLKSSDAKKIDGVFFLAKEGIILIRSKIVIDCTGDADIAALAGAPTLKGDETTGEMQAGGMFFSISGVDEKILQERKEKLGWESMRFEKEIAEAAEHGDYPIPRRRLGIYKSCDDIWMVNATRIPGVDGTCSADLTKIVTDGRKQIFALISFLKKYVHGFENIRLENIAQVPGVRETRRILGKFMLQEKSLIEGEIFSDVIAVCSNSRDTHAGLVGKYIPSTVCYTLPYRILLPQKIENLLAAGRNVSCDRAVLAAIRVMPPCFALGEAAGNAAVLALESGMSPEKISVKDLQKRLLEDGAVLSY